MKKNEKNLKSIEELRSMAKEYGVLDNPLFETTLTRYETQIQILDELKKAIDDDEVLVFKEYVKGRANVATHPAITEYNRTTDSANKTVATLMKIIKGLEISGSDNDDDPLLNALNGSDGNE